MFVRQFHLIPVSILWETCLHIKYIPPPLRSVSLFLTQVPDPRTYVFIFCFPLFLLSTRCGGLYYAFEINFSLDFTRLSLLYLPPPTVNFHFVREVFIAVPSVLLFPPFFRCGSTNAFWRFCPVWAFVSLSMQGGSVFLRVVFFVLERALF